MNTAEFATDSYVLCEMDGFKFTTEDISSLLGSNLVNDKVCMFR